MARIGQLFGGRGATDRDGDGVDDRAERPADRAGKSDGVGGEAASETRTWRLGRKHDKDGDGTATSTIAPVGVIDSERDTAGVRRTGERDTAGIRRTIDREPVTAPTAAPERETEPVPVRQAPARVSLLATFGLMLGLVAAAAALTGLLAPWAIPIGALGLLFSFGGIIAGVRPNVAGRGLGTLGVLVSGTAVVFGILAMTGQVSWLDSDTDQVARLNDWLDAKLPWMKDW
ncbi:MAG TPA: hypothetical protein VL738_43955 [Dactylosporangium sp.]|nr:hypothetical protein [Dactylosporangium sp.]